MEVAFHFVKGLTITSTFFPAEGIGAAFRTVTLRANGPTDEKLEVTLFVHDLTGPTVLVPDGVAVDLIRPPEE